MRILVVGGSGMLGSDVVDRLSLGHEVASPSSSALDITDPVSVAQIPAQALGGFDWCVNCAAYTQVDRAESEPELAYARNAAGAGYLARACALAGVKVLHVSTDFVFDGAATRPYEPDDAPNPLGVYGRSKLEGEIAVRDADPGAVILRTSWLFGPRGTSFPRTIIRAWEAGKPLRVVNDQVGNPTYTYALADTIASCLERSLYPGIYHAVGPESMTWYELAQRTLRAWSLETGRTEPIAIEPISTADWPTPARRPQQSVLATHTLEASGIEPMPSLEESLREFCRRLRSQGWAL